jgi:hypothetical protein
METASNAEGPLRAMAELPTDFVMESASPLPSTNRLWCSKWCSRSAMLKLDDR